jgi:ribosomal protein S20
VPHHKQFEKSLRRDAKRRLENRTKRARLRHAIRDFRQLASVAQAEAALPKVHALLDRSAKIRLVHPRAAARLKSRLAAHLERLRAASRTPAPASRPSARTRPSAKRAAASNRSSTTAG